jgi:ribonuclease HI
MENQLKLFSSVPSKKTKTISLKSSKKPATKNQAFKSSKKPDSKDKKKTDSIIKLPTTKELKQPSTPSITLIVFVDGAARGNPGPAGAGVYITTQDRISLLRKGYYLVHKTNNQAEYIALILACLHVQELIKNEPTTRVIFNSDSQLLVRQIQGLYKVRNEVLITLHRVALKLLRNINYSIRHVMREENTNADKLANFGVDKKVKITQAMAAELSALGVNVD